MMGKSARKQRKSQVYEGIPSSGTSTTSAVDIHDDQDDLLSSPREFVPLDELALGESSSLQVAMLLVAGGIGATVVVMPYVFLLGGFVMTLFMVLFFTLASYFASACLVQLGVANGIYSLQGLAKLAFGTFGAHLVGILQLVLSCGLVLTYLAIIFQDLPVLLGHLLNLDFDTSGWPVESSTKYTALSKLLGNKKLFGELFGFIVVIPFCLVVHSYRKIQNFALVSVCLLLLTSLCVVGKAKYFHDANVATASQGYDRDYLDVPKTLCQAFGVLAAQFANQHHTFHAFYAMSNRAVNHFMRVSLAAAVLSAYLAYTFGIGGYVSYLRLTRSDMVLNLDLLNGRNRGIIPFWLLVPICALFCIPLEIVSSRYVAMFMRRTESHQQLGQEEGLVRAKQSERQQYTTTADVITTATSGSDTSTPHLSSSPISAYEDKMADSQRYGSATTSNSSSRYTRVHIVVTFLVLVVLVQITVLTKFINIATLLSVTGGIAGIAMLFIIPAACFLKLAPPHDGRYRPADSWFTSKCLPWTSILIGVVASIACLIANMVQD